MKFLILLVVITLSYTFLCGCEWEQINITELMDKTSKNLAEENSYVFKMEIEREIFGEKVKNTHSQSSVSGEIIVEPMQMKMEIKNIVDEMNIDIEMYLKENSLYMYTPFLGWIVADTDKPQTEIFQQVYSSPIEHIATFYNVDHNNIEASTESYLDESGKEANYYLLTYSDESGYLATYLTDEAKNQLNTIMQLESSQEIENTETSSNNKDLVFNDVIANMLIDRETLLPAEYAISYNIETKVAGEIVKLEQKTIIKFSNYGMVEKIRIPESAKENSVSFEDLFE